MTLEAYLLIIIGIVLVLIMCFLYILKTLLKINNTYQERINIKLGEAIKTLKSLERMRKRYNEKYNVNEF